jgi:hypothetical protein
MPGFNTIPAVGGGGGQANMTFVASVHMETYNRSWAQGGTAGYYAMYSTNQENGYVYFVGTGQTTGAPLNRLSNITHSFTRIDIIAPVNDMVSLYKAKVKATTAFANPFAAFASFPSTITSSGNFVLPNNALPLVNCLIVGGGGGAYHHSGGGGGGNVVTLTAYQAVGTTSVTIGAASGRGAKAGDTYFGNVYALGGGGTSSTDNAPGTNGGNGGGAGNHNSTTFYSGGTGTTQTSSNGLGISGSPTFAGGHAGGSSHGVGTQGGGGHVGGGSGGAGGPGTNRPLNQRHGIVGGLGAASDISGSTMHYGCGGGGSDHNSNSNGGGSRPDGGGGGIADGWYAHPINTVSFGSGGNSQYNGTNPAQSGAVIVRYYIP